MYFKTPDLYFYFHNGLNYLRAWPLFPAVSCTIPCTRLTCGGRPTTTTSTHPPLRPTLLWPSDLFRCHENLFVTLPQPFLYLFCFCYFPPMENETLNRSVLFLSSGLKCQSLEWKCTVSITWLKVSVSWRTKIRLKDKELGILTRKWNVSICTVHVHDFFTFFKNKIVK